MLKLTCILAFCLTAALGLPSERIMGGSLTTIDQYPFMAVILRRSIQRCGGTIINNRSVMTAVQCFYYFTIDNFQVRVGSSFAHSGGTVHQITQVLTHPDFNANTHDSGISIVRVSTAFTFGDNVQPGRIPGINYIVPDNQAVWTAGWGATSTLGQPSEQLRDVEIWTVNQDVCRNLNGPTLSDNMLCAYYSGGGRGSCFQDAGGPLLHNGVAIGIASYGAGCGHNIYPGVYVRVSRFSNWIQANA